MNTDPNLATILVWHQGLCPRCCRYMKCAEWWEIIQEFNTIDIVYWVSKRPQLGRRQPPSTVGLRGKGGAL